MIIYWIQVCQLENYDENVSLKPNRPNNREREVVRKERERERKLNDLSTIGTRFLTPNLVNLEGRVHAHCSLLTQFELRTHQMFPNSRTTCYSCCSHGNVVTV